MKLTALLVLCLFIGLIQADVYMHWLRGSNNRFRGPNNNQQRLFNSQNNNKGGYNVGEIGTDDDASTFQPGHLKYYEDSLAYLEWTNQHSCGPGANALCEFVLQYMCDNGVKDYNGQQWSLTDTDANGNDKHEPAAYKTKCNTRGRNKGLFISDQNVNANGNAQATRQNPGATEYGNECQEERDYYPYWHPTPWKDIAIFTTNTSRCPYYQAESFNVKPREECECSNYANGCTNTACWQYNNRAACTADTTNQCQWVTKTPSSVWTAGGAPDEDQLGAPECLETPRTRDNHLGNGLNGQHVGYTWRMPTTEKACGSATRCTCTFRLRYNMSSIDLHELQDWQLPANVDPATVSKDYFFIDSQLNGRRKVKMDANNYYGDNTVLNLGVGDGIQIGHNTNQVSRTFQDRSHLFEIWPKPGVLAGKVVHNVGVRGKRGNIVQAYPAVEYDFVPTHINIYEGQCIHFQWTGSNSNPNGNDGQGRAGTDRSNIVQIRNLTMDFPLPENQVNMFGGATSTSTIAFFASGGYTASAAASTMDANMNNVSPTFNAALMNGGSVSNPKLICDLTPGTYSYMSTRNNNFTNRTQKGTITVWAVPAAAREQARAEEETVTIAIAESEESDSSVVVEKVAETEAATETAAAN